MKPRLLDLFCGAGGAAMGYHRAGFDVVGVDINPQPHYPFGFHQGDALTWPLDGFDAVHASPPCQAFSASRNIWDSRIGADRHPDLLTTTRERLKATGVTWVIENVPGAPMGNFVVCCGLAFGLGVKRHRWFESNVMLLVPPCPDHDQDYVIVFGGSARGRAKQIGRTPNDGPILRRPTIPIARSRAAMGIDWMTRDELSQAIPPAYTEFIGGQLLAHLGRQEVAS